MDTTMPRYPEDRKAAVLGKLLPPHNRSVPEIAKGEGISEATLYNWLKQTRHQGVPVPGSLNNSPEDWSGEAKFAVVIETAPLNASELSEYCRTKGLYPEQVARWRQACIEGAATQESRDQVVTGQLKVAKQRIRTLEKDLRRKEKALAESAALLVLQKKFNTLWEDAE
jgi:transposase